MAFDDLKNKLREKAQLFDEGGINALKSGKTGVIPYKVRRSVVEASDQLERQHSIDPRELRAMIKQHREILGNKPHHREAQKFWTEVDRYIKAKYSTRPDGSVVDFIVEDDAGKGWPPFEKPSLLNQPTITAEYSGRELPPVSTEIVKKKL